MSSITIADHTALPVQRSTRLRLTARGRRVLVALAVTPIVVGIAVAGLSGIAASASDERSEPAAFDTVVVLPGDTLWSIAAEVAPDVDPREVIDEIQRLNLLADGQILVGQQLAIPTEYSVGG